MITAIEAARSKTNKSNDAKLQQLRVPLLILSPGCKRAADGSPFRSPETLSFLSSGHWSWQKHFARKGQE